MCLSKNVQAEAMYGLFSIISLCGFSKLDCAQFANHLKKDNFKCGYLESGCGSCHKQVHFTYSLNLWLERASEKLGPEVITGVLELPRGMDTLVGGWKLRKVYGS